MTAIHRSCVCGGRMKVDPTNLGDKDNFVRNNKPHFLEARRCSLTVVPVQNIIKSKERKRAYSDGVR